MKDVHTPETLLVLPSEVGRAPTISFNGLFFSEEQILQNISNELSFSPLNTHHFLIKIITSNEIKWFANNKTI